MVAPLDQQRARAELGAVIASGIFAKAPGLAQFLKYVCDRFFEGRADEIKEYNIAVEALGRPASFDQRKDSIVRVEAFRLRKRLKQYYESEGAGHPIQIVIPPGQYVPQFVETANTGRDLYSVNGSEELGTAVVPADPLTPELVDPPVNRSGAFQVRWLALVGLPILVVVAATGYLLSRPAGKTVEAPVPTSVPAFGDVEDVRIMAGSPMARYIDRQGQTWLGDRFFRGGSVFATPGHPVSGTPDPLLFQSRREGEFSYHIPLKPGIYELHLFFAETLFGENNTAGGGESSRVFRISMNDKPLLSSFDVISDANGSNIADEKVFKDVSPAPDGMLHLQFSGLVNNSPFVNAIEIVPGVPGTMRPVRVVAAAHNYTDQRGRFWGADRYFRHGTTVVRSDPVTNTPDPELYRSERYGNFTYTIPAVEGRYAVTLKFSETWFGAGQPGGGGEGSRIFDVYCNGMALLRNFDIVKAAGGHHRAVERTFRDIAPNAQGKIVLSFIPVLNYACVNAIEVIAQ
ncbi:MAG: malectin domain-containing carbohydrate-binding protein [Bryobacteraceae bacterium]